MLITINGKIVDVVNGVKLELTNKKQVVVRDEPKFTSGLYIIDVYHEPTNVNYSIEKNDIERVLSEINVVNDTYSIKSKKVEESKNFNTIVNQIKALKEHSINGNTKPKFSLMPQKALLEVAKVFTYGEHKYEAFNYSKGENVTVYIDAAMRHINAFLCNEDIDNETKTNHLANATADLLMTLDNILNGTSVDDRNKYYK